LDWLATFHLELLQSILFISVQLSAPVFLATCFNIVVEVFPRPPPPPRVLLLQICLQQTSYA
jgi:hypothetical protein